MGVPAARPHSELWLDFLEGMGGTRTAFNEPIPEVRALVETFHSIARNGRPEEVLAAFYAYESQVPRVAAEKARGLRERYGADEKTCGYFTLHTTADVYHSRVWKSELSKAVEGDAGAADRALDSAEHAAKSLWAALDGIEAARMARSAAA
jgi:pyrroloquinoline-quinone synthase